MSAESNSGRGFVESEITIWTEDDYYRLLDELSPIFDAPKATPEFERCVALCNLIWEYEQKHCHVAESPEEIVDKKLSPHSFAEF